MEVLDFRFLKSTDLFDLKYNNWSRAYEYPLMIKEINDIGGAPIIHNSSWGYEGVHVIFRDELDNIGECVHSDIVTSKERDSYYYDITTEHDEFQEHFDFVLNVSVIEHLPTDMQIVALDNLFCQVKKGGYFLLTFDYPRVDLSVIEKWCGQKCEKNEPTLNGGNSIIISSKYENLNIIYLKIKK